MVIANHDHERKRIMGKPTTLNPNQLNALTPKISLVILLTVCHTVLMMFVWRIWYWINLHSLNLYFYLFSSLVCLILY